MSKPAKYLTQNQLRTVFNKFQSKETVEYDELVLSIDEEIADRSVEKLSPEEVEEIKKIMVNDPEVLEQLRSTKRNREAGTSRFVDTEEDFKRLFEEVKRGQKIYESESQSAENDRKSDSEN